MPVTLSTPVTEHIRLTAVQKDALKRLRIKTIEDLLYHFPTRYGDTAEARSVDSLQKGQTVVIFGKIHSLKISTTFKTRVTMAEGYVEDETGQIQCVWFNQPYIAKMFTDGSLVRIEGKVSARQKKPRPATPSDTGAAESFSEDRVLSEQPLFSRTDAKESFSEDRVLSERSPVPLSGINMNGTQASYAGLNENDSLASARLYFSNPKIEKVDKLPIGVGDSLFGNEGEGHSLYPVYSESRGISSSWLYHTIQKIFSQGVLEQFEDPIPEHIRTTYHLPSIKSAFVWMHAPQKREDALSARKRFSFQEIFLIQLQIQRDRRRYEQFPSFKIETSDAHIREFVRRFPFTATSAQTRAIETITTDMRSNHATSRLLEGDVGSGKTAVAAATAYAVMTSKPSIVGADGNPLPLDPRRKGNLQIAYMCPTEILAIQHFESFIQFFSYMPVQIGLITGSGCRKFPSKINPKGWTDISRSQLLSWVESGDISVLIGTHVLIQKSVSFKNLAYVIIDEQHRFGTRQRGALLQKNGSKGHIAPHLLSMTATPIPRTLALTMYGDLDLTVLDEIPAGRKPIITELVLPAQRSETYEKIRNELQSGRQAYVICPRIDEADPDKQAALNAKSVKEEARRLKRSVFPEYEISILHSKMKPAEKDLVMSSFKQGKIHILCATSVVEVGVNVPNATCIIIEGAERFGLSQLHQLRGRVMRSTHQAYCYIFTETSSAKSIERLTSLKNAANGFELAELDLKARGAGELSGSKQWGISDVAMDALQNIKMVEAARTEAISLITRDPELTGYPLLQQYIDPKSSRVHFE
ncbi:MAG: ATP-dependent DNA helicase RecG [Patescibacteria group bacterium]